MTECCPAPEEPILPAGEVDAEQQLDVELVGTDVEQLPAGPAPVAAGTFAIYEDGQGGYVLVADMPAHGGITRRHIPAAIVKMATGGGLIARRFGGLFGA